MRALELFCCNFASHCDLCMPKSETTQLHKIINTTTPQHLFLGICAFSLIHLSCCYWVQLIFDLHFTSNTSKCSWHIELLQDCDSKSAVWKYFQMGKKEQPEIWSFHSRSERNCFNKTKQTRHLKLKYLVENNKLNCCLAPHGLPFWSKGSRRFNSWVWLEAQSKHSVESGFQFEVEGWYFFLLNKQTRNH